LEGLTKGFQRGVEDLISSGRYDTKDDFTVVVQPFMTKMSPPLTSTGSADYSYFAPDCFHFSTKGHQAAAVELWNSLVRKFITKILSFLFIRIM
jgi:phospholipase B1